MRNSPLFIPITLSVALLAQAYAATPLPTLPTNTGLVIYVQRAHSAQLGHLYDYWYRLTLRGISDRVQFLANFEGPSLGYIPTEQFVANWEHGFPSLSLRQLHANLFYSATPKDSVEQDLRIQALGKPVFSLATHAITYEIEVDHKESVKDGFYTDVVFTLDGIRLDSRP